MSLEKNIDRIGNVIGILFGVTVAFRGLLELHWRWPFKDIVRHYFKYHDMDISLLLAAITLIIIFIAVYGLVKWITQTIKWIISGFTE